MQGPTIPWRPGRQDRDVSACTPDGRLPDASKDQKHIREVFERMGFDDREMVALCGAHSLGRAHTDRSGYDGPWDFSPTVFSNEFFRLLADEKWSWKKVLIFERLLGRFILVSKLTSCFSGRVPLSTPIVKPRP